MNCEYKEYNKSFQEYNICINNCSYVILFKYIADKNIYPEFYCKNHANFIMKNKTYDSNCEAISMTYESYLKHKALL